MKWWWLCVFPLMAQDSAMISGVVRNSHGAELLAGAEILLQNEESGARWRASTNQEGQFVFATLPRGTFTLRVRFPGFRTVSRSIALEQPGQQRSLEVMMEMIVLREVITVSSGPDESDPASADVLRLRRGQLGPVLPLNGPDVRGAFDLLPGVNVVRAPAHDGGQFSANGQRPNAHAYRIDGLSASNGVGLSALPGAFPGASLPAVSAMGAMDTLAPGEAIAGVEFRPAAFAPEFGDRPGAQIQITTRAGKEQTHGSLRMLWRPPTWQAADWFTKRVPAPLTFFGDRVGRTDYGLIAVAIGGPVPKLRRNFFYHFAGDMAKLNGVGAQRITVPARSLRANGIASAITAANLALSFFPVQTGQEFGGGLAEGLNTSGGEGSQGVSQFRMDAVPRGEQRFFFRAGSSSSDSRSFGNGYGGNMQARTLASGWSRAQGRALHEIRIGFSRAENTSSSWNGFRDPLLARSGLLPWLRYETPDNVLFPTVTGTPRQWLSGLLPSTSERTVIGVGIPGLGLSISGNAGLASQTESEVQYTMGRQQGQHQSRMGLNFVRRNPRREQSMDAVRATTPPLAALLSATPTLNVTVLSLPAASRAVWTGSLFAQNTWKPREGLSLLYGARYEVTPPLNTTPVPYVSAVWDGTAWSRAFTEGINVLPAWPMRYAQVAPRAGLAWRRPSSRWTLRAGAGLFYDTTLGMMLNPVNGAPFNTWQPSTGVGGSNAVLPDMPLGQLSIAPPELRLPGSWQMRASLERPIAKGQLSTAWHAAEGRHLLRNEAAFEANALRRFATQTQSTSRYQSLQARYHGEPLRALFVQTGWTLSRSVDDASTDSSVFLQKPAAQRQDARAVSSFDVRHSAYGLFAWRPPFTQGWSLNTSLRWRSGFPIDVLLEEPFFGLAFVNHGRPDRVAGQATWLSRPDLPGGRQLNRAAFALPAAGRDGNLGRNALRGYGLMQWDASLQRNFRLWRGVGSEFRVGVYNFANAASMADPTPWLSSPFFGESTSMLNRSLGEGRPGSGMPGAFLPGSPRNVEFSFRFHF
jgi:hypothetical protein